TTPAPLPEAGRGEKAGFEFSPPSLLGKGDGGLGPPAPPPFPWNLQPSAPPAPRLDFSSPSMPTAASPLNGLAPTAIQLHDAYLVVETHDGMLVIDQHALHERILFEQLRQR